VYGQNRGICPKPAASLVELKLSMAFVSGSGAGIIIGGKGNKIKTK
jgi:hypothetical protein